MAHLERLLHDEPRLGHGALGGVNQNEHAVYHHHYPLYLAREVCVARGIDNVYLNAIVVDGRIFGKYGYSALTLERVGVHDPLLHRLVVPEGMALLEHCVDEGGLAVVDVRDYCNIS